MKGREDEEGRGAEKRGRRCFIETAAEDSDREDGLY